MVKIDVKKQSKIVLIKKYLGLNLFYYSLFLNIKALRITIK